MIKRILRCGTIDIMILAITMINVRETKSHYNIDGRPDIFSTTFQNH